jgi:O-antigen/teichoic acid export membrane protein
MIRLVEPRVLGLYAVAVTLATMPSVLIRGMNGALFPRIAAGDGALTAKALRITLLLVGVTSLALAVICKPLLTVLLGEAFADATPLVLILLVGGLMRAGAETLESSITADGAPGATAVAQALALIVTVPGLVLLVPTLGGEGAALVSVAAYGVTFAYLLAVAYRRFDGGLREFLLATPADFKLLLRTGRSAWSRARHIWPRPTAA